jgi:hypothetical protein
METKKEEKKRQEKWKWWVVKEDKNWDQRVMKLQAVVEKKFSRLPTYHSPSSSSEPVVLRIVCNDGAQRNVLQSQQLMQSKAHGIWSYLHYIEICRSCVCVCRLWSLLTPRAVQSNWRRDWNLVSNYFKPSEVGKWSISDDKPYRLDHTNVEEEFLKRLHPLEWFRFPYTWLDANGQRVYNELMKAMWKINASDEFISDEDEHSSAIQHVGPRSPFAFNMYLCQYLPDLLNESNKSETGLAARQWMAMLGQTIESNKLCMRCGLPSSESIVVRVLAKSSTGRNRLESIIVNQVNGHKLVRGKDGHPEHLCLLCRREMISFGRARRFGITERAIQKRGCLVYVRHHPLERVTVPFISLQDFIKLDAPRQRLLRADEAVRRARREVRWAKMIEKANKAAEDEKDAPPTDVKRGRKRKTFATKEEQAKHDAKLELARQRRAARTPEQKAQDSEKARQRRLSHSRATAYSHATASRSTSMDAGRDSHPDKIKHTKIIDLSSDEDSTSDEEDQPPKKKRRS